MNETFSKKLNLFKQVKADLFTKTHIAYRNHTLRQSVYKVYVISVLCALYAALLYFITSRFAPDYLHRSPIEFVVLLLISVICFVVHFIMDKAKVYHKKTIWLDHVIFLTSVVLIGWSVFCFYMSVSTHQDANYLTLLIVITCAMTFFRILSGNPRLFNCRDESARR